MAGMAAIYPEGCGSLPGAALVWSPLVPLVLLFVRVAEEGMYGKYHLVLNVTRSQYHPVSQYHLVRTLLPRFDRGYRCCMRRFDRRNWC